MEPTTQTPAGSPIVEMSAPEYREWLERQVIELVGLDLDHFEILYDRGLLIDGDAAVDAAVMLVNASRRDYKVRLIHPQSGQLTTAPVRALSAGVAHLICLGRYPAGWQHVSTELG